MSRNAVITLVLILIVGLSAFLIFSKKVTPAPPPPPPPPPPDGEGIANVFGFVTDSATGAPIRDVEVSINGTVRTTREDGFYGMPDLPVGTYTIAFTHPLYVPQSQAVTLEVGNNIISVALVIKPSGVGITFRVKLKPLTVLALTWVCAYKVEAAEGAGEQTVGWQGNIGETATINFVFDPSRLGGMPPVYSSLSISLRDANGYPIRLPSGDYTKTVGGSSMPWQWWPEDGATYLWDTSETQNVPPEKVV